MRKIYTIPFNANFIHELVELIYEPHKRDYSRRGIVFSGKRPFLYLQKYLSEKIKAPYYPPFLFSVDTFIDYIVNKQYPDVRELEFLDAVRLLYSFWQKKDWDFSQFFPWGIKLLQMINQIDTEDVENAKLTSIQNNASIGFDIPDSINQILQDIVAIREKFHHEMEQTHVFTRGYKYLKARNIINDISFPEFDKIYCAGLFGLNQTTKVILRNIHGNNQAEIIWQANDVTEWKILEEQVNYFASDVIPLKKYNKQSPDIKLYSSYDTHSEVIQTYNILHDNQPLENTCVVLPQAEVLFPLLSLSIDRLEKRDFNISLPYPVNRTSLFALIKDIVDCQLSTRTKNNQVMYYAQSYLKVLQNPFIKNLDQARESIYRREEEINNKGVPFIDIKQCKLIPEIQQLLFHNLERIHNLYEAAECLEHILDYILENSPIRSYILSGEIFHLFFQELLKIKQCNFAKEHLSPHVRNNRNLIGQILLHYLQMQVIPFETKPLQDLEIIGFLETRNLNFDNVIILNVEEGIIPKEKEIDPLIPLGVYEQLGLPSIKFNEEMYRYYFYRLIQGAKAVHLLYMENDEKTRSRYIEQIIWNKEKQEKTLNVIDIHQSRYKINLITKPQQAILHKDEHIYKKLLAYEYSPTMIDAFLQCQLGFYYRYVLNIKQPKQLTDDIEVQERGTIIHRVLKKVFEPFLGKIISPQVYEDMKTIVQSVLQQELENKSSLSGEYYVFRQIAEYKLNEFLKKTIYENKEEIIPQELEKVYQTTYETKYGTIQLKGKIDRLDKIAHQSAYLIIDYKTGSSKGTKQYSLPENSEMKLSDFNYIQEHVTSCQLPIYVLLFHKNKGISLEHIKARLCFLGDNKDEDLFTQEDTLSHDRIMRDYYMKILDTIINEILDKNKNFVLYESRECGFCDFQEFCVYKINTK